MHQSLDQAQGRRGQPDAPRGGELLHARGQVRGLAHRRVVHVQIVADGPHHHFSGVEADAQLHLQALGAAHLLGIAPHGGLHRQGGVTGPQRVILMGHGRAKQGHDAIAQHLVHGAFKAVHGVHHVLQGRIEELLGGFRIEIANQLGGAFEVGKQHRDLLALAFQGTAGGENFLGEIGGRVGKRRLV